MNPDVKNNNEKLTRREREKLAHRQEILDAATRIFAQKGFFNATLDEIAQEAEFSKGALYLYFSNKEDLLHSIIQEKSAAILKFLKTTLTGKSSFQKELHMLFDWNAELAFKEKDFVAVFIAQHFFGFSAFSEERKVEFCKFHDKLDEIVINRIVKAIETSELRDLQPESIYGIIRGAIENMMITQWKCETVEQLQNAVKVFIDILFNGIANEKEAGSEN